MWNSVKVKLCWKTGLPGAHWHEQIVRVGRVPLEGEYISLDVRGQRWFRIQLVVHYPEQPDWTATIWAVEVDELEVERERLASPVLA
jgi:hypothetical protein